MRHLDEVDTLAARIGAVNTIVNEDGWLKGYNTDGLAAMRALEESFGDLNGVKAVVLGAGGAARAIGYHLSTVAEVLVIVNRTLARAEGLVEVFLGYPECRSTVSVLPLGRDPLRKALDGADIVVNATSLGMEPNTDKTPIEKGLLGPSLLVLDAVYNPPKTRLLKDAEAAGARTLAGISMLVYQGAAAFKLWTGRDAPEALMMKVVERSLGGG
jgi:shikimate dehydrogenase